MYPDAVKPHLRRTLPTEPKETDMRPEGWHIVIIIVIAIVLFGAPKLPGLARSVGQSLRIFKSEVRQMKEDSDVGLAGDQLAAAPTGAPVRPESTVNESKGDSRADAGSPPRQANVT